MHTLRAVVNGRLPLLANRKFAWAVAIPCTESRCTAHVCPAVPRCSRTRRRAGVAQAWVPSNSSLKSTDSDPPRPNLPGPGPEFRCDADCPGERWGTGRAPRNPRPGHCASRRVLIIIHGPVTPTRNVNFEQQGPCRSSAGPAGPSESLSESPAESRPSGCSSGTRQLIGLPG